MDTCSTPEVLKAIQSIVLPMELKINSLVQMVRSLEAKVDDLIASNEHQKQQVIDNSKNKSERPVTSHKVIQIAAREQRIEPVMTRKRRARARAMTADDVERDVPITWSHSSRAALPCVVASWERVQLRRQPPPPLDEERARNRPFVWRKNGTELSSKRISSNGTLEVSKKREGEGVYQCAVRHHGRLVLGYPVNLKFAHMDKQFSIHPANETVKAGQPAVLRCEITSGPPATIIWEKDGSILSEDARHHILANDLIITDVTKEDAGSYRCKANNPHLNRIPLSHIGKLEVEEAQEQDVSFLSVHHEGNITAARGSRVVLPCPVMGWPRPKLIWEHTPPVGRTSELEETSEVLVLSKLEYDQEGLYTCSVEGHSDLAKLFNVTLTEPVNITLPPVTKEALRASTVRFNCTATGRPQPVVTWYKDGQPLELLGRFNLRNSIDRERIELVISGLISDDAGIYQCFAANPTSIASGWAQLSVRGGPKAAAPGEVTCAPVGPQTVEVRWLPAAPLVTAYYTVYVTPRDKPGSSNNGQPRQEREENVTLNEPLTPYFFHVRAFIPMSTEKTRNIASDMSQGVVCQGQGIPITLFKLDKDMVMVSWKKFADQNPGVVEWILQHKAKNDLQERNITLDGAVYNYTLHAPESEPRLVRVLGSRSREWLVQDLTRVPWSSTAAAGRDLDDGDITVVPDEIYAVDIEQRSFGLRWAVDGSDKYSYMVCVRRVEGIDDCRESLTSSATVEGLQPDSEYEVRIQARIPGRALGGPFSRPVLVTTKHEGPLRFKDLRYKFINSSTLRVSWSGSPARYTVRHSTKLVLPVDEWATIETTQNTVLIHNLNPVEQTFVMVTGYNPEENSQILNIPAQMKDLEAKDLQYSYSSNGVTVWCSGAGPKVVRFAQNITLPVEKWHTMNVTDCATESSHCELTELDPALPVYVMLVPSRGKNNQVLTIPPRPLTPFNYQLWLAIAGGLCVLGLLVTAAVCIWRRRKRTSSPNRRRRRTSVNESIEEEGSEMKGACAAGARLANGGVRGVRGAGEPLLNGHVHITENPASKTPNGRTKKGRRYDAFDAFDVSRADADTTMETTLDASLPGASPDASRCPEFDLSRNSREPDFNKLPDDNMNSELNSSDFPLDSSKIQPTLQPNG